MSGLLISKEEIFVSLIIGKFEMAGKQRETSCPWLATLALLIFLPIKHVVQFRSS